MSSTKRDSCENQTRAFFSGLSVFFGAIAALMYANSRIAIARSRNARNANYNY